MKSRPQIKKSDLFYWAQGMTVIFYIVGTVALIVSDHTSYLDLIFSIKCYLATLCGSLMLCYGAHRLWPAPAP